MPENDDSAASTARRRSRRPASAGNLVRTRYGVGPYDAATLAAVTAAVVLAAPAASAIPARRAARLDPMTALRAD